MSRFSFRILLALTTFGIGILGVSIWFVKFRSSEITKESEFAPNQTTKTPYIAQSKDNKIADAKSNEFRVIIPPAEWEKIYFEPIKKLIRAFNLTDLRAAPLPEDDLELRIWRGFGEVSLDCFVIKRIKGNWSAIDMGWLQQNENQWKVHRKLALKSPKSGWEAAWQNMTEAGILILPDAEAINCSGDVTDGTSFVVEYNFNNTYRTYMYDNPDYAQCNEAKQMIEINKIISDDFYNGKPF